MLFWEPPIPEEDQPLYKQSMTQTPKPILISCFQLKWIAWILPVLIGNG